MNSIISHNASNVFGKIKLARGFHCSVDERFDRLVLHGVPWHRPAGAV